MNPKFLCLLLLLAVGTLDAQSSVTLLEPANGAANVPLHPVFKWTEAPSVNGYVFEISEKPDFSSFYAHIQQGANSLPMQISLLPNTKYFWRVRTGTTGDWSSVFSLTTKDAIINLNTTLVEPADNSEQNFLNSIIFKWRKNDGFQYVLQLSNDKAKINNDFFVLLGWDTTYRHLPQLELNKTYYWRVCALAPQGPWSSIFSFKMVDPQVTLLAPHNHSQIAPGLVKFKWKALPGISAYDFELAKDEAFDHTVASSIIYDTVYNYPDEIPNNSKLYWRVRTSKLTNNTWAYGRWSETFEFSAGVAFRLEAVSFPNPFADVVTIGFQLEFPGNVKFEISDSHGLPIDQFEMTFSEAGSQLVTWHSKTTSPGIYFCKIIVGQKIEIVKLLLTQ